MELELEGRANFGYVWIGGCYERELFDCVIV